jgi:hypothetical protein
VQGPRAPPAASADSSSSSRGSSGSSSSGSSSALTKQLADASLAQAQRALSAAHVALLLLDAPRMLETDRVRGVRLRGMVRARRGRRCTVRVVYAPVTFGAAVLPRTRTHTHAPPQALSRLEMQLASLAIDNGKALVIGLNKADAVPGGRPAAEALRDQVRAACARRGLGISHGG